MRALSARSVVDPVKRFWSYVSKSEGCWIWTGTRDSKGYGRFVHGYKNTGAHRMAYALCVGPIPRGHGVLHRCDNPPCVNPDHLFTGTQLDNMGDAARKRRTNRTIHPRGEAHYKARLSASDVVDIRSLRAFGARMSDLAVAYGVGRSTIKHVVYGTSWRSVA